MIRMVTLRQIERSPDHWWVTPWPSELLNPLPLIERSPDHWWVTPRNNLRARLTWDWKVTRSLVSYAITSEIRGDSQVLKGHQIIGELRLQYSAEMKVVLEIERSPDHWWVTPIIPPILSWNEDWKVTRSLVSYASNGKLLPPITNIERSPDHWWVTPLFKLSGTKVFILKGHQIIGELRLDWRWSQSNTWYWKVTRSLVSYAPVISPVTLNSEYWKVTRSLVSYANILSFLYFIYFIERSPDHWWVTPASKLSIALSSTLKGHQIIGELRLPAESLSTPKIKLKGHQIIGELRHEERVVHSSVWIERSPDHWWVTPILSSSEVCSHILKGHQIIGELRHK